MSLFQKNFWFRKIPWFQKKTVPNEETQANTCPILKLPVDERFTINFKANGGKFLYTARISQEDLQLSSLTSILNENDWNDDKKVFLLDDTIKRTIQRF